MEYLKRMVSRRKASLLVLGAIAVLAGASVAVIASPAAAQETCGMKACDTDYDYCATTDIRSNCSGSPCKSTTCDPT